MSFERGKVLIGRNTYALVLENHWLLGLRRRWLLSTLRSQTLTQSLLLLGILLGEF